MARGPSRRTLLKAASAGALAAPALLRASPAAAALGPDIGSMLLIGFDGTTATAPAAIGLAEALRRRWAGGVMFHTRNVGSRDDIAGLASAFSAAGDQPLLAIDQEGGDVQRLSSAQGFTRLPRARAVAARMDTRAATELYATAGAELIAAGINFNLAPVADLDDRDNPVIGAFGRAFSADAAIVTAYAAACIDGFSGAGVLTAVKHFPGHGRSRTDSHTGPVDITRTFRLAELLPFRDLVASGKAGCIMAGHLTHRLLGGVPASLSPLAIDGLLRRVLGHHGVVITDDLDMDAIRGLMSLEDATIAAVAAGNDLMILSNSADHDPDLARKAVGWIVRAITDGRLPRERIAEAAARIRRFKQRLEPVAAATGEEL